MRILLADDHSVVRHGLKQILAEEFKKAVFGEASNGRQAVDATLTTGFNLILMDVQMPGLDGIAATQTIRATSDLNRSTPILALSASVMPAEVEACRQAGMNDHVAKPINTSELLNKIVMWTSTESVREKTLREAS